MRRNSWKAAVIIVLGLASGARAGEVQLLADSQEAYVGVPFKVAISVSAERDYEAPVFPELANAEVVGSGEPMTSSSMYQFTINGQQVGRSRTEIQYIFSVTPREVGVLRVPAIEVRVDGEVLRTKPAEFQIKTTDPGDLLYVELGTPKDAVFVGEPVDVTLRIWMQVYNGGAETFDGRDMWASIQKGASNWGPFLEFLQDPNSKIPYEQQMRPGLNGVSKSYFVYTLEKRIWPQRAGPMSFESMRIVAEYPIKVGREPGIFGSRQVVRTRPVVAGVTRSPLEVKSIPTEGRPPYYSGAVGPYDIQASAAPVEVRVGDPITLKMTISGAGQLDLLQAPPLAEVPAFTKLFQVSNEQLPGTVTPQGKQFTQSIRPLSDVVTEIPPIPLAYFDTDSEEFVTVYSEPIPIVVAAAAKMSTAQIVESGEAGRRQVESLTHSLYGIEGNYADPAALLAQQGFRPSAGSAVLVAASPLLCLTCVLVRRGRHRLASDLALARRRSARKNALRRMGEAAASEGTLAAASMQALLTYIADRLNLPAGGLTREEAVSRLRAAEVDTHIVDQTDAVLMDCERAQFGGGSAATGAGLAARVRDCVEALERQRFQGV